MVAANQNNGDILSPDCRPIQELIELGVNHYIDKIKAMTEEADTLSSLPHPSATKEDLNVVKKNKTNSCYGSENKKVSIAALKIKVKPATCCENKKTEGCVICGQELVYSKGLPTKESCNICGEEYETYTKCPNGHYICDTCHSLDILGKVDQLLTSSNESNPVKLAQKIFELPGLNMHGPEYHSIVPAVLVTAYQNFSKNKDVLKIKEAIKRGKDIKGGNCGFLGNCGSGVGAGIAVSIIEGATPMSRNERGVANIATGYSLIEIGKHGGPRCYKREAITSIESFMKVTGYFNGLPKSEYICKQYAKNKDCIGKKCPYFPVIK